MTEVGMHGDVAQPARPALERYLRRALALLRWVTLAVLLAIVVTQPSGGYRRLPMWALVTVFAGYSLVLDGFRWVLLRCLKAVRFERSAASLSCLFQGPESSNRPKTPGSTRLT